MVAIKTVKVRGSVYFFMLKWLVVGSFFPRLPNSFFFFQKIKRCYLDTEHRGRRAFLACVARQNREISPDFFLKEGGRLHTG